MAFLCSVAAVVIYRTVIQSAQSQAADDAARQVSKDFALMLKIRQQRLDQFKSQSVAPHLLKDPQDEGWTQFKRFFAGLDGKADGFTAGVLLLEDGQPVVSFGAAAPTLRQHLANEQFAAPWVYDSAARTLYGLYSTPLSAAQGQGRMVMLRPINADTLKALSVPQERLLLMYREQVLASSDEEASPDLETAPSQKSRLRLGDAGFEQRVLPVFGSDPAAPHLVLQTPTLAFVNNWIVVSSVLGLVAALTLVLWLVIGQWVSRVVNRMTQLSRATTLFADDHLMSEPLVQALQHADARPDEIGDMALSLQGLMHSVMQYDQQYFAYMETLDILEEGVVELWPDGRYQRASPGWARLTGQARQPGELLFDSIHPDYVADFHHSFVQLVAGEKKSISGRMRLQRADDIEVWVEHRFVLGSAAQNNRGPSVSGVMHDITQSHLLEAHVMHMAMHDALTALPNRVLLEDRAKIALRMAERSGKKVALGFLDLDHFKHVNDQFGHRVGDELLLALAENLRHCLRAGDTLARWGGDEFVVLLPELGTLEDAREVVAKLVSACESPIQVDGAELNATLSIGVALYPDDAQNVSDLLLHADRAMFMAKEQGRNTVRFYADFAHREQDRRALQIQNRLVMAIREHQIQTWYQPIVDARTHRVVGCEALARWYDPTYGWVSPATFAPMAEKLGLIRDVGQQVWLQAMDSLQRWRAMGLDIKVSVNVSRRQFFSPTFTAELHAVLVSHDIPVSSVELEITESVAMEDTEHTMHRLGELAQAGFGIAIDDFGTGYSSLSQLHDMPANKIKIDISFVQRANSEQGKQLIQAIVNIAGAYNLQTVAEGVETAEVALAMREFGVDLLQGYHFGHAMSPEDFERYLLAQP